MGKKLKCVICNDIIESKYRHDYAECKCGKIFVDGGDDYLRFGGDLNNILFDYNNKWIKYNEFVDIDNYTDDLEELVEKNDNFIENSKERLKQAKKEILDILKKYDCRLQARNLHSVGLVTEDYVVNQAIQETIEL